MEKERKKEIERNTCVAHIYSILFFDSSEERNTISRAAASITFHICTHTDFCIIIAHVFESRARGEKKRRKKKKRTAVLLLYTPSLYISPASTPYWTKDREVPSTGPATAATLPRTSREPKTPFLVYSPWVSFWFARKIGLAVLSGKRGGDGGASTEEEEERLCAW